MLSWLNSDGCAFAGRVSSGSMGIGLWFFHCCEAAGSGASGVAEEGDVESGAESPGSFEAGVDDPECLLGGWRGYAFGHEEDVGGGDGVDGREEGVDLGEVGGVCDDELELVAWGGVEEGVDGLWVEPALIVSFGP